MFDVCITYVYYFSHSFVLFSPPPPPPKWEDQPFFKPCSYFSFFVCLDLFSVDSQHVTLPNIAQKKNSSRRNAWGNFSYADLITQAITSAVDNRLTLSQIYEWMVQNVPYFKDKGDSNSSAGWKVRFITK